MRGSQGVYWISRLAALTTTWPGPRQPGPQVMRTLDRQAMRITLGIWWILCSVLLSCGGVEALGDPLDYDDLIMLDAEELAEGDVKTAYDSLLNQLSTFVPEPTEVREILNPDEPSYTVIAGGKEYPIFGPGLDDDEGQSWGRAAYALFSIVNSQLADSTHRFYAINGGNDLGGMFLTQEQVAVAKRELPESTDWPYLPTMEHPNYGQQ